MPRVGISVGSNVERERHVPAALRQLAEQFGELVVSPVYEAQAVGFDGAPFFNLVVGVDTELLSSRPHQSHGREPIVTGQAGHFSHFAGGLLLRLGYHLCHDILTTRH